MKQNLKNLKTKLEKIGDKNRKKLKATKNAATFDI